MSDTNDVADPPKRTRATRKASRLAYSLLYNDLQSRVKMATAIMRNRGEGEAQMRLSIALDVLEGS